MNRLTARTNNGQTYYPECFRSPCYGYGCHKEICEFSIEICNRLAAYEDTGMTPEKIIQMNNLYREKCEELDKLQKEIFGYTE